MDKALFSPLILKVAGASITPLVFFLPLALIVYLFTLWKQLKDEYPQRLVVNYSLQTLVAFTLIAFLTHSLGIGDYFFPTGFLGLIISSIIFSSLNKWNYWYILEKTVLPIIFSAILIFLGFFLTFGRISYPIHILFFIIAYLLLNLWSGYRSFAWYHSGKAGFLFLAPLMVVLLLESGLDFYLANGLYWRSLFLVFASLGIGLIIFIRSRKK